MGKLTNSLRQSVQESDERMNRLNAQMDKTLREFNIKMLESGIDPNTGKQIR